MHDLRHTAACDWILQGAPLTTVQAWLGHSSIEITAHYLHHLGDSADRSALQLLNDATARALAERARQLSDPSRFGRTYGDHRGPDRGLSL